MSHSEEKQIHSELSVKKETEVRTKLFKLHLNYSPSLTVVLYYGTCQHWSRCWLQSCEKRHDECPLLTLNTVSALLGWTEKKKNNPSHRCKPSTLSRPHLLLIMIIGNCTTQPGVAWQWHLYRTYGTQNPYLACDQLSVCCQKKLHSEFVVLNTMQYLVLPAGCVDSCQTCGMQEATVM